jgi:4-hydroxy 2-oxovalerate aldolase
MIFVTNSKRFSALKNDNSMLVMTSNIENYNITENVLNYSSYINDSKEFDNTVLMLFKVFVKIGIKSVNIAGLDGFSSNAAENYASENLLNTTNFKELSNKNSTIYDEIRIFEKNININFITTSLYNKDKK